MNIKKLFLSAGLLLALLPMQADDEWCLTTNTGQIIPLSQVTALVSLGENATTFNILTKDATLTAGSATFAKVNTTGIRTVHAASAASRLLPQLLGNTVTLQGVAAGTPVAIYSLAGTAERQLKASSATVAIDVTSLPAGTYILKVGHQSLKFLKR